MIAATADAMTKTTKSSAAKAAVVRLRPARKCPICGRPATQQYYPFDTKRCADADLAKWLGGGYAIAGEPARVPEEPTDDE